MDWLLWLIWIIWMTGALLSMGNALLYSRFRERHDKRWLSLGLENEQRKVCWIVAMKGFDKNLTEPFFDSLTAQSYSNYRLIFTFESERDEGYLWLRKHLKLGVGVDTWEPDKVSGLQNIALIVAGAEGA